MALTLPEMIELGDPDELLREIDRRSERRDWAGMVELRDSCLAAVERGKQLWGVAGHAAYRLALEAEGAPAGAALATDAVPFLLGPLPEVAASTHAWSDLAAHLAAGPTRGLFAHERVVRGEDLTAVDNLEGDASAFELPLRINAWEPTYAVADYRSHEALFPAPTMTIIETQAVVASTRATRALHDPLVSDALAALARSWVDTSNGKRRVVAVHGGYAEAFSALGVDETAVDVIDLGTALAQMAWAAGSGGAHGRRPGAAAGRAAALYALAVVCGSEDDWPGVIPELGAIARGLQWCTWGGIGSSRGWALRIAVHDPDDEVTFAIDARDTA